MGRKLSSDGLAEAAELNRLAEQLRAARKSLGLTMDQLAKSASISRVTLHRIEKGEPNVSFGAVASVAQALGMPLQLSGTQVDQLPESIAIAEYPGLRTLSWQLRESARLSPAEAWSTYTRNWRHLKHEALEAPELRLIELLRQRFERGKTV